MPACEQFEVFQSVSDPNKLFLLELCVEGPGRARRPCRTAGAAPAFAGGAAARRWQARGLRPQPYPLNRGAAKCRSRISKPADLPRRWPMSAGAYDREAGFCAFRGMVERSWEGAAAPVRAARWPNGYPVAD